MGDEYPVIILVILSPRKDEILCPSPPYALHPSPLYWPLMEAHLITNSCVFNSHGNKWVLNVRARESPPTPVDFIFLYCETWSPKLCFFPAKKCRAKHWEIGSAVAESSSCVTEMVVVWNWLYYCFGCESVFGWN